MLIKSPQNTLPYLSERFYTPTTHIFREVVQPLHFYGATDTVQCFTFYQQKKNMDYYWHLQMSLVEISLASGLKRYLLSDMNKNSVISLEIGNYDSNDTPLGVRAI